MRNELVIETVGFIFGFEYFSFRESKLKDKYVRKLCLKALFEALKKVLLKEKI